MKTTEPRGLTRDSLPYAELSLSDDLASLERRLEKDLPGYLDIASAAAHEKALAAWPLLAECLAWHEKQQ